MEDKPPENDTIKENEGNVEEVYDDPNETQKILKIVIDEMDKNMKNKKPYNNKIISGIEKLDEILLGFNEGDLNIIASRPGIGKTTFALNMFTNITSQGINSLYISFEKKEADLLKSIIAIETNIDSIKIDNSFFNHDDYKKMINVVGQIYGNSSIYLKSFYNTDLIKLKKYIEEEIKEDKIKIVFIDYLTMIIPAPSYTNRWEQVSEISRSLKSMAMEFNIPFVVLCPIHRNIVDISPEISDLSESGSIEYEADRVLLLYKKPRKKKDMDDIEDKYISVYVAKNRRGPTAVFDLFFDYKHKRICDIKYEDTI